MTLRETIAEHASGALTRLDHFGENVVVLTNSGATATTVKAVVHRFDVEPTEATTRVVRLSAMVFLPTTDLAATPIPGDEVRLPMRIGASTSDARITRIDTQDEGGIVVEVQT